MDSRLCRSILLLSGLDMMLLDNHFKVCATLAFYSKWNSSMRPTIVQSPRFPHHVSFSSYLPYFLHIWHTGFSQCLLPRSLLLHGKLFPGGHTVYSCSVLSFHENLPFMTVSCRLWWALILSCSLHPGFNFVLCLTWLSFYSTILKVPWGQRQNWVLLAFHLLCLGTCSKYSINVCRMNERRTEWVS